jgi:hypothetical protein
MTTIYLGYATGTYADVAQINQTVVPADSGTLGNCRYVLCNTVDFRGAAIVGGTDDVEALKIPANTLVDAVWVSVDTADADITDVDLGDGSNKDGWLDGISFASTGVKLTPPGVYNRILGGNTATTGFAGKFYLTADTIDIDVNTVHTTSSTSGAKIRVYASCFTPRAV